MPATLRRRRLLTLAPRISKPLPGAVSKPPESKFFGRIGISSGVVKLCARESSFPGGSSYLTDPTFSAEQDG
jgi:hypothetical protein